jgi:hypothetical protein
MRRAHRRCRPVGLPVNARRYPICAHTREHADGIPCARVIVSHPRMAVIHRRGRCGRRHITSTTDCSYDTAPSSFVRGSVVDVVGRKTMMYPFLELPRYNATTLRSESPIGPDFYHGTAQSTTSTTLPLGTSISGGYYMHHVNLAVVVVEEPYAGAVMPRMKPAGPLGASSDRLPYPPTWRRSVDRVQPSPRGSPPRSSLLHGTFVRAGARPMRRHWWSPWATSTPARRHSTGLQTSSEI